MGKIRDGLVKAGAIGLIAGGVASVGLGVKTVFFNENAKKIRELNNRKEEIIMSVCQEDEYKAYSSDKIAEYARLYNNGIIPRYKYDSLTEQENLVEGYLQKNDNYELTKLEKEKDDFTEDYDTDLLAGVGEALGGAFLISAGVSANNMLKSLITI